MDDGSSNVVTMPVPAVQVSRLHLIPSPLSVLIYVFLYLFSSFHPTVITATGASDPIAITAPSTTATIFSG